MSAVVKPSATSAANTAFCATKIEGPGGHLWIDGNGKITAGNGTLDRPKPNAFSLVQVKDCPGSTEACRSSCYVHGLEKHAPDTHALYQHNSRMIREILEDRNARLDWVRIMSRWLRENCPAGFRWHVSGDIFSHKYAVFIAAVSEYAAIPMWIYTRSFQFVPHLLGYSTVYGGHLTVNLSADRDNWENARDIAIRTGLRLCYMSKGEAPPAELPDGSVIFPDYNIRGGTIPGSAWFAALDGREKKMVCPVDYHGKSEARRCGPCARCLV